MAAHDERARLQVYADEIGMYFADKGLSRMLGRVLGWLLVCDPPQQSAEELAAALGVSRGSVSMATQALQRAGVVEPITVRGSRRTYYRLRPGFWLREADDKARIAEETRKLAERGLDLLAGHPEEHRRRLQEMHDMYAFLEQEYARIRDLWHERQESQA